MTLQSVNFAELMLPGLRKIYDKQLGKLPDMLPVLFNVETSTKQSEANQGMGGVGQMVPWGGSVAYADFAKGFKATYTHIKYSNGLQIQRELLDDDQYGVIKKRTRLLANSVWYTRQFQATGVFNNAFNGGAQYLGPDAKALCAVDHPVAPGSGTVYSNVGTLPLTADNVETTRTAMKLWTDDKGNILPVNPDTIIVPTGLRKAAKVIADSPKEPDTANNNVNVWQGALKVVELPLMTDQNNWFVADSMRMQEFLNWYDRRKAILEVDREDFNTEDHKYKVVGRWSKGWDDASFIYGHNPA